MANGAAPSALGKSNVTSPAKDPLPHSNQLQAARPILLKICDRFLYHLLYFFFSRIFFTSILRFYSNWPRAISGNSTSIKQVLAEPTFERVL